jgi:hypothetical protein
MNRTVVFAGFLSLVATVATAQPSFLTKASEEAAELSVSFLPGSSETATTATDAPVHLNLAALSQVVSLTWSATAANSVSLWQEQTETPKRREWNVDWVGLLNEQAHIDALMHFKRMTESKTRSEVAHSSYYGSYVEALKGYFRTGARWNDGDPFLNNDINHPLMGAISSHVYTNHDRRCQAVGYGDSNY